MCLKIILSMVKVAGWQPLGEELLTRLTMCSLCKMSFVILAISQCSIVVLIVTVPGHCLFLTSVIY